MSAAQNAIRFSAVKIDDNCILYITPCPDNNDLAFLTQNGIKKIVIIDGDVDKSTIDDYQQLYRNLLQLE